MMFWVGFGVGLGTGLAVGVVVWWLVTTYLLRECF